VTAFAKRVVGAEGEVPNTAERVSSRPQWLQQLDAGNAFNAERVAAKAYPYNEVYINKPGGSGYTRLDSYNPNTGEIVSRKFTQLSDIQGQTALGYINEIPAKYPVDGTIANVPSSGELAGQLLQGQYILEVPVQVRPIPPLILDGANGAGVLIRDVNGRIY
jgi:filamentous hemagglutinin